MAEVCSHIDQIRVTAADERVCEECVAMGDTWVHLRLCMTCGKVGCCDSSKNKHASKHAASSNHPIEGAGLSRPAVKVHAHRLTRLQHRVRPEVVWPAGRAQLVAVQVHGRGRD